jgi:hypothetical protein
VFVVLWQFMANGGLVWLMVIGVAMSISLGQAEAKASVVAFGVELATIHVVSTGIVIGLLMGSVFLISPILRLPFIGYLAFSFTISLFAARWHFRMYRIPGPGWIPAGLVVPVAVLVIATVMIVRDHQQRRLMIERAG